MGEHRGHRIGPELYKSYQHLRRKLTDDDKEYVAGLVRDGVSRRNVAACLSHRTGATYTAKHLQPLLRGTSQVGGGRKKKVKESRGEAVVEETEVDDLIPLTVADVRPGMVLPASSKTVAVRSLKQFFLKNDHPIISVSMETNHSNL